MICVVYWASAEGAHPHASVDLNKRVWPIMHRQVRKMGYELTVLTVPGEKIDMPHEHRIDFDVDPKKCALAREQAWSEFLGRHLSDAETAVMVEPDTFLRKPVPDIADGFDLVLFRRNMRPTPCCLRIAKPTAYSYYALMARLAAECPPEKHIWGCDMDAQDKMLSHTGDPMVLPRDVQLCLIEARDWRDYCMDPSTGHKDAIAWCFNGSKGKQRMLSLA